MKVPAQALQFREEGGGLPDDPVAVVGGAGHGKFRVSGFKLKDMEILWIPSISQGAAREKGKVEESREKGKKKAGARGPLQKCVE